MNDSIECKCCLRIKQLENMIGQYELHKKLYEQEYEILHKRYEDNKWLSKRLHDSDGKLILKLQRKLKELESEVERLCNQGTMITIQNMELADKLKEAEDILKEIAEQRPLNGEDAIDFKNMAQDFFNKE